MIADEEKNQRISFTEELVGSHLLKVLSYYSETLWKGIWRLAPCSEEVADKQG